MSKVAVLVVTNRPDFLPWWTHQILKQTRQPDEVIVVDNRDDTPLPHAVEDCLRLFGGRWVAKHTLPSTRLGSLRQAALDACTSDIILWFDDDDWYHPRRIELSAEPIESGRYDVASLPLTHFYYLKEGKTMSFPSGTGVHLPATAWRADIAKQVAFKAVATGEDHFWIHALVHPLDGSAPLIPTERIRWISDYIEPNFGGMVVVHDKNSWQTPLARRVLAPYELGELRSLPSFAPKDVPEEDWRWTRQFLADMRAKKGWETA